MKKVQRKSLNQFQLIGGLSVLGALTMSGSAFALDPFDASEHMTGDWGGARKELHDKGYDFNLEYVGEVGANAKGGYNTDKTARYSDQFAIGTQIDLEKVFGLKDAEFKFTVTERSGRNISNDRIGDPRTNGTRSSSQEVWGRGQTWRLTQLWVKQKYFDGKLDVKLGRMGEGEDFGSFPCDFQNLTFCGTQAANYVDTWYNWPISQNAVRVKYNITPEFFAQIGVYEQNPSLLETGNGFKLNTSGAKGTLVPVEAVWSPTLNAMPGEYRLGWYYSSPNADDLKNDVNGQPQVLTKAAFETHSSKHGWWFVAQQKLINFDGDSSRGLSVFFNATTHDKATNYIDNFQNIGVVLKGPFASRPKDDIGVGFSRIHVNDNVRDNERLANQQANATSYDDPNYIPIQKTEYNSEIYYGVHVNNWLTIRPNLQYVIHPGASNDVDNALVAGIKLQTKF